MTCMCITVLCGMLEVSYFSSASTRLAETDGMPTECWGLMAGGRKTGLEIIYAIFSPSKNINQNKVGLAQSRAEDKEMKCAQSQCR